MQPCEATNIGVTRGGNDPAIAELEDRARCFTLQSRFGRERNPLPAGGGWVAAGWVGDSSQCVSQKRRI